MKGFWNKRYNQQEFVYGEAPNEYFKAKLSQISAGEGEAFFPAEGEGRNAVYAAKNGWEVFAFDQSEAAKEKACLLASKNGVGIDYQISELEKINYPERFFDMLVLIFAHFPQEKRRLYHQKLFSLLRKGGVLILEAFGKDHIHKIKESPSSGGPNDISMLYALNDLKADFEGFDFIECYEAETELNEGLYHNGPASVIRILAVKRH